MNCVPVKQSLVAALLITLFSLLACQEQSEGYIEEDNRTSFQKWLYNPENYNSPLYQDTFISEFNRFNAKGQYDSVAAILNAYGATLSFIQVDDSLYFHTAKSFALQHLDRIQEREFNELAYNIGEQYNTQGQLDSSNSWLHKTKFETDDSYILQTQGFANIIFISNLSKSNNYDSAAVVALETINLFKRLKDTVNMANAYLGLSNIYGKMKLYQEAEIYDHLCLDLSLKAKDSLNIFAAYSNLIYRKKRLNQMDSLGYFAKKLLQHQQSWQPHEPMFKGHAYVAYGIALHHDSKLDSARRYFELAQQISPSNRFVIQESTLGLHAIALDQKKPLTSTDEIFAINEKFIRDKNYQELAENYNLLSEDARLKGQYTLALDYLATKFIYRDSSWNDDKRGQLFDLDKKYQTAEKEKQLAIQQAEIQKSKFQIGVLLFSLLGIVLLSLIYFTYRKRKQAQQETILQQKFTDDLIQNTEDERKRIATDLHDGVNHELLTLKNNILVGKSIGTIDIEKVINGVREVSRDLYPAMFDSLGLAASIEALCERLTQAGWFTTCELNYTSKLSKRNELQLYRIIQEALNNTLKHAKANAAKVTIETKGIELWIEIEDDGIGFNAEEKMKNSQSFGMQSLYQRARALGGKSTYESSKNGTKLILKTPIH